MINLSSTTVAYGLGAVGVGVFFLGIGAGALLERWRMLRRPLVASVWAWERKREQVQAKYLRANPTAFRGDLQ